MAFCQDSSFSSVFGVTWSYSIQIDEGENRDYRIARKKLDSPKFKK
jgi:hypothetical protein